MKTSKLYIIAAMLLITGVVLSFIAFAITGFRADRLSSQGESTSATYISKTDIKNIVIDDSNTAVTVVTSPDDKIHVTYYTNDKQKYSISETDSATLEVTKVSNYKWYDYIFNIQFNSYDLTIAIPSDYQGDFNADTSNGGVYIQKAHFKNLDIDTSNGRIELENIKADSFRCKSSNARIILNQIDISSGIDCQTSNGKIELGRVKADSIRCKSSNAQILLEQVDVRSALNCDTSNGRIEGMVVGKQSDFSITSDTSNGSNSLPKRTTEGSKSMIMDTSNAKINITFTE